MRLIDADKALEKLCEFYSGCEYRGECQHKDCRVVRRLKSIPTAYDVDKVVEELEMETCVNLEDVYKNAIDIVRRGGVE